LLLSSAATLASAQKETASKGTPGAVAPCPNKKCWIEIVLQDEDGKPIANEEYRIVTPDGSERTGRLDGNGYARLDGLDPGSCDVMFPKLYERMKPEYMENS
jgi:hypothetical protein